MAQVNKSRLFLASCVALVVTAMTFAIRAGILDELKGQFTLDTPEGPSPTLYWGETESIPFVYVHFHGEGK